MTTPNRMPPYEVRNDGAGPYVVFLCEKCRREFRSAVLAGPSVPEMSRQAVEGLLRKLPVVGETIGSGVAGNGGKKTNLTLAQLAVAWSQVLENFQQCPTCNQVVCKEDFDTRHGTCKDDRPCRVRRCAACGAEVKAARFCPQCGAAVEPAASKPAAAAPAPTASAPDAAPGRRASRSQSPAAEIPAPTPAAEKRSRAPRAETPAAKDEPRRPSGRSRAGEGESAPVPAGEASINTRQYVIEKDRERYEILFTTPEKGVTCGGLDERLAGAVDKAQKSIDIAAFEFDLPGVAAALIRAHRRGVKVRLVTDSDNLEETAVRDLKKAGVKVVDDQREAFMHDKFVVIDGRQVWTGSWNLTVNCTYRNNNNAIVLFSSELAENYTHEFEEMFSRRRFGAGDGGGTPHSQIRLGKLTVENYFAPEDDVMAHILAAIDGARKSICFLAFSFTDESLAKALIRKRRAGVTVQGVVEARNAMAFGSELSSMRRAGVEVLPDGNPHAMHDKVIIVDEALVVTGSFNFTSNARQSNDENVLILHSPAIARRYLKEFQQIFQEASAAAG